MQAPRDRDFVCFVINSVFNSQDSGWHTVSVVESLSHVWLSVTPWTAARQASLAFTISWSLLRLMSTELVMLSNHLILCRPPLLLCLQSFPESGSFPMSQFFASDGQSTGASASASVLPTNIWGWFPLGLTSLISLQSKGLSRVFSSTTVQKHQFFRKTIGCNARCWSLASITWGNRYSSRPHTIHSTTVGGAVYIAVYVQASTDLWGRGVFSLFLET